jgi:hypothetical protein
MIALFGQTRAMHPIPEELLTGPFTVGRARELGVSDAVLRGRRFVAPFSGVRLPASLADDVEMLCRAAALILHQEAAFSHATALRLWHLPLPLGWKDEQLDVAVPRAVAVPDHAGLRGHDALWSPEDIVELRGLRVTRSERVLCDLAGQHWSELDLLTIADAVLSRGEDLAQSRAELERHVAAWAGRRGAVRLREVLALADAPVDSAMETRLRYLLVKAGIPRPCVNRAVLDDDGGYLHTPDLTWPRWKVAVEYDGEHHFLSRPGDDQRRRRTDVERQERMHDAGWLVRVMTKFDVLRQPASAVDRTLRALRERGCPI